MVKRGDTMPDIDIKKVYDPVTILIYDRKRDVTLKEISFIAFEKESHKITAIGNEALPFLNHADNTILVLSPLKHGMIADYTLAQAMFKDMLKKASVLKHMLKPRIAVCIPSDSTEVERKAFQDVFYQSGAREVLLSEESIEEMKQSLPTSYHVLIEIVQSEKNKQIEEIWNEVGKDKIPFGVYETISIHNHKLETTIVLSNSTDCVQIKFGQVIAMRMLEKKVIPDSLYSDDKRKKFAEDKFEHVMYQIENGEFSRLIKENENKREPIGSINRKHYIIISSNYIIEVLAETEPDIRKEN